MSCGGCFRPFTKEEGYPIQTSTGTRYIYKDCALKKASYSMENGVFIGKQGDNGLTVSAEVEIGEDDYTIAHRDKITAQALAYSFLPSSDGSVLVEITRYKNKCIRR